MDRGTHLLHCFALDFRELQQRLHGACGRAGRVAHQSCIPAAQTAQTAYCAAGVPLARSSSAQNSWDHSVSDRHHRKMPHLHPTGILQERVRLMKHCNGHAGPAEPTSIYRTCCCRLVPTIYDQHRLRKTCGALNYSRDFHAAVQAINIHPADLKISRTCRAVPFFPYC